MPSIDTCPSGSGLIIPVLPPELLASLNITPNVWENGSLLISVEDARRLVEAGHLSRNVEETHDFGLYYAYPGTRMANTPTPPTERILHYDNTAITGTTAAGFTVVGTDNPTVTPGIVIETNTDEIVEQIEQGERDTPLVNQPAPTPAPVIPIANEIFRFRANRYTVEIVGECPGELGHRTLARIVHQGLSNVVHRNIRIVHCRGNVTQPVADTEGYFYVYLNGSPTASPNHYRLPWRIMGYRMRNDLGRYQAWQGAPHTLATQEGHIVGSCDANHLFVYIDPTRSRRGGDRHAFAYALGLVAEVLNETGSFDDTTKTRFIELCKDRAHNNIGTLENQIALDLENIEIWSQSIMDAERRYRENQISVAALKKNAGDEVSKLEKEFEALKKIPHVTGVMIRNDSMRVYTDTIYIRHPVTNNLHKIGRFVMNIDLRRGIVRFNNQDRPVNMMNHHPHVFQDGHACFGNIGTSLLEMIRAHELSAFVQLAVAFLEQANIDDSAGSTLRDWPIEQTGVAAPTPAETNQVLRDAGIDEPDYSDEPELDEERPF